MISFLLRAAAGLLTLVSLTAGLDLCAQVDYGNYNLIIRNYAGLHSDNHIHRGALVGNTLDASGSGITLNADGLALDTGLIPNLYVGGSLQASSAQTVGLQGGNFYYQTITNVTLQNAANTTANTTPQNTNASKPVEVNGKLVNDPFAGNFASEYGRFQQEAARMAGLATTGTVSTPAPDTKFTFNATSGTTNVFNISASTLSDYFSGQNTGFDFEGITASTKLIINVFGDGGNFTFNPLISNVGLSNINLASNIVWNFRNFNTLTFTNSNAFWGTILAADSGVNYGGQDLEGQLIAYNLVVSSNHEFHNNGYFTTELPPIPEPSTYALLGAASCTGLALLRRRRRAA